MAGDEMMASPKRDAFSHRLDQIISSLWTADYQSIVSALDELEKAADPDEHGHIERRRAIADVRLLAAHKKKQSIAKCDEVFSVRLKLGFATIADEATTVGGHARYCQQAGDSGLAAQYATDVLKKIEETPPRTMASVPEELTAVLRGIASGRSGEA